MLKGPIQYRKKTTVHNITLKYRKQNYKIKMTNRY